MRHLLNTYTSSRAIAEALKKTNEEVMWNIEKIARNRKIGILHKKGFSFTPTVAPIVLHTYTMAGVEYSRYFVRKEIVDILTDGRPLLPVQLPPEEEKRPQRQQEKTDRNGHISISEFAKCHKPVFNLGRNEFFKYLRDKKYLSQNNKPRNELIEAGYFVVKRTPFKECSSPDKEGRYGHVTKLTQKGADWLFDELISKI